MKKRFWISGLLVAILAVLLTVGAAAENTTIYVSQSGGGDGTSAESTTTLTYAVTSAVSGDTICIMDDITVSSTVTVDKSLTFQGMTADGSEPTISTGDVTGFSIFSITASDVSLTFQDLAFDGSGADNSGNSNIYGGAISASGVNVNNEGQYFENIAVNIFNCTFIEFEAHNGGAVCFNNLRNSTISVDQSRFTNNKAGVHAGGIGIEACRSSSMTVKNSYFEGNTAHGHGGAIALTGISGGGHDSIQIENCQFIKNEVTGNSIVYGGGAIGISGFTIEKRTVTLTGNTFTENRAGTSSSRGGAVFINATDEINVINNTFTSNVAAGHGGAINMACGDDQTPIFNLNGNTFTENIAGGRGGALHIGSLDSGNIKTTIPKALFQGNSADGQLGNAIVYFYSDAATTTSVIYPTDGAAFKNNGGTLETGGTIYLQGGSGADDKVIFSDYMLDGTRMLWKTDGEDADGNDILEPLDREIYADFDLGQYSGSLYLDSDTAAPSSKNSYSNSFIGNKAGAFGGAIFNYGSLTIGTPGTDITVNKVWQDENGGTLAAEDMPASATVNLVRSSDSATVDSASLTGSASWSHTFYGFPSNVSFQITETAVAGFTPTITGSGSSYTVTNKKTPSAPPPAITIRPADITIYMGGEGYEGTVGSDGELVTDEEQLKANGFPEPGFLITLPEALQNIDVTSELTLIYKENNEAVYQWKFEKYGEGDHNIYRIVPMGETAKRPVRMQFTSGETVVTDDQFNVAQYINQTLAMKVYGEGIDAKKVSFVYNGQAYPIAVENGQLTVRGTTAGVQTAAVAAQEDFTAATGTPGVTAPAETTYTINNSPVQVDPEHTVALLFDGIIDSLATGVAGETYTQLLKDKVDAVVGAAVDTTRAYDCRYLDLVDQSNGNAWVTASNPVTVYWPLPQGTSSSTQFTLLHFEGLHRSLTPAEISNALTSADYTPTGVPILQVTDTHVVFEVSSGSFSPFVLVWESGSWQPPITPPVTPPVTPEEPDEPDQGPDGLNTQDHYAYIVGYPDGTVRPEGSITRAEVATIFFRLLTDEARSANWSQTSGYTDVTAGSWYNNAISTLSRMGILEGYDDDTFRPNGTITRAEFVTIATRFFRYSAKYTGGFSDVPSGAWYADYIQAGVDLGLIGGYPDGTFVPDGAITRAEACAIVNRTLGRKPHADYLLAESVMNVWPDNLKTAWYYADIQEATNSHDYDWVNAVTETLERWTAKLPERDWAALEKAWSTAYSAPGNDVMD